MRWGAGLTLLTILALSRCGARTELDGAKFDAGAMTGPCTSEPFGTLVPISELRTSFNESGLRLSPDGLTALFASDRPGGVGGNDLFMTSRPTLDAPFGSIEHLANVSSPAEDWDPTFSADGRDLFFGSTRAPGSGSDQQLYGTTRADAGANFDGPSKLPLSTLGVQDHQPFLRADGAVLYWSSARSGNWDIYRATRDASAFGPATLVSELSSSASQDWCPIVTPDDLTVYFATDRGGPGTRGDFDVWVATRASTSAPFGNLQPLTSLSSTGPDLPCFVTADGCTLYVASDRPGGAGGFDLYVARRQ